MQRLSTQLRAIQLAKQTLHTVIMDQNIARQTTELLKGGVYKRSDYAPYRSIR
jgi:hypothetical protein